MAVKHTDLLVDMNKLRALIRGTMWKCVWVQIVALRNIYRGCHGVSKDVVDVEYDEVDGTLIVGTGQLLVRSHH
jgi:hypothetical protein